MEEAREKALQEVTDHYEAKLLEKEQQREQVRRFIHTCHVINLVYQAAPIPCVERMSFVREEILCQLYCIISCRVLYNPYTSNFKVRMNISSYFNS